MGHKVKNIINLTELLSAFMFHKECFLEETTLCVCVFGGGLGSDLIYDPSGFSSDRCDNGC